MIRVVRGSAPAELIDERGVRLPQARQQAALGALTERELTGYQKARSALHLAQHGKCAYCECRPLGIEWNPVEHYRPKGHYWWLTWTWENLLFACPWCNSKHKRTQFPLTDPAARLQAEALPPGLEEPLVIDPASGIDPREHMQFVKLAGRWQPIPRNGSAYGSQTIRVLGLDQPPLIDAYQRFHAEHLEHLVSNVADAMHHGDAAGVQRSWAQLTGAVDPAREFTAFALDVIESAFDAGQLAQWGLSLPSL